MTITTRGPVLAAIFMGLLWSGTIPDNMAWTSLIFALLLGDVVFPRMVRKP